MDFADMVPVAEESFKKLTEEKYAEFDRMLNMSFGEWVMFQEKKSLAQAEGRMSVENALWVYEQLGGDVSVFNSRPVAIKYLMTQIFKKLLELRV